MPMKSKFCINSKKLFRKYADVVKKNIIYSVKYFRFRTHKSFRRPRFCVSTLYCMCLSVKYRIIENFQNIVYEAFVLAFISCPGAPPGGEVGWIWLLKCSVMVVVVVVIMVVVIVVVVLKVRVVLIWLVMILMVVCIYIRNLKPVYTAIISNISADLWIIVLLFSGPCVPAPNSVHGGS